MATLLILVVTTSAVFDDSEIPPALKQFIEARKAILRADVYWRQTSPNGSFTRGQPNMLHSIIAGDEIGHVILGTPDGATAYQEDGTPLVQGPTARLRERGAFWHYMMDETVVQKREGETAAIQISDYRSIGMSPFPALGRSCDEAVERALPRPTRALRYSQRKLGNGTYRVEATADDGEASVVWVLDPKLDWNATRVQYWVDGRLAAQCLSEYDRVNGTVVPVSCLYLSATGDVVTHVEVDTINVNDPALPNDLTPEYIGIEPGFAIFVMGNPEITRQQVYLGAGRYAPSREAYTLISRGEIKEGDKVLARRAGRPLPYTLPDPTQVRAQLEAYRNQAPAGIKDAWETYTKKLIERYSLDSEQRQKAFQVLRQCQARRNHYLRGRKSQIETLKKKLSEAVTDSVRSNLNKQLAKLHAPVERIFETELKPRLGRLPTRAQLAQYQASS